jgi:AraC-like DNA-binding protein
MACHQLIYSERPPREELKDWIQCLWTFDARHLAEKSYEHYVPPDGCVAILQNVNRQASVRPLILVGPRWTPTQVAILAGDFYFGIRCWPFAARALLENKISQVTGLAAPIQFLMPDLATELSSAVSPLADQQWHEGVQDVLCRVLKQASPIDSLVRSATEEIALSGGNVRLEHLAEQLHVSLRQLQRRFLQETGFKLKQFSRIRRFREAARELLEQTPRPWCHVAADVGYADQAHLTREFVQLIGLPPKQLQSKYEAIFHDSVEP